MTILITGTAGFIGFHVANRLIKEGHTVIGVDSINNYYDVSLKYNRLAFAGILKENIEYNKAVQSSKSANYFFHQININDKQAFEQLFKSYKIEIVINLAAQAGVSHSITNPEDYILNNISGF